MVFVERENIDRSLKLDFSGLYELSPDLHPAAYRL